MPLLRWERVEPTEPCVSPEGHTWVDMMTFRSSMPESSVCPHCNLPWTIVVTPAEDEREASP